MSEGPLETKRISCNTCNTISKHQLHARHVVTMEDTEDVVGFDVPADDVLVNHSYRFSVWICGGCGQPTMELQVAPGVPEEEEWRQVDWSEYYPPRSRDRIRPKHFTKLSSELRRLYTEVVTSYNEGCFQLCTIGLRALVEAVCDEKGLKGGNLMHKIEGLIEFLPSRNLIDALHHFRFAGNEAAHNLGVSTEEDARAGIQIMEDLLNFLYDLDYRASQMKYASKSKELRAVAKHGTVN